MEILDDNNRPYNPNERVVYVKDKPQKTNGIGLAGFIISLLCLLGFWVPVANWIMWIIGLIFSLIGVFKKPRGFAIAGLCISLASLLMILVVLGLIAGMCALPFI